MFPYRDFPTVHLRRESHCSSEAASQAKAFFPGQIKLIFSPRGPYKKLGTDCFVLLCGDIHEYLQ